MKLCDKEKWWKGRERIYRVVNVDNICILRFVLWVCVVCELGVGKDGVNGGDLFILGCVFVFF